MNPILRLAISCLAFAFALTGWAQEGTFLLGGMWCGNVTPTSATVAVRLNTSGVRARLQVSTNPNLSPAIFSSVATTATNSGSTVKLTVQGLDPDTDYYYGVEIGGTLRPEPTSRGKFRTFPLGKASFRIAFGSCGDFEKPDQRAYAAIMNDRPLLFINMGDLHYHDTNSLDPNDYRANYDQVLNHSIQGALYRSVPVAYMWDDHDFCGNDSDTTALGRDTARLVYKERVPHYPLGAAGGTMAQAFTIGRVRFIMTDLRSAATPSSARETASKTKLGAAQKAWFKQELVSARDSGFPLVVWVCPDPWIMSPSPGDDSWGGHTTERTEIANFIRDNGITNLVILSGDMHGLAFDDGTHSDYATGGGAPITVLHAAALTSDGSIKGGPYTGGPIPGSQQYGILDVYDGGGTSVACRYSGMKVGEGRKLSHFFSGSMVGGKDHALVNISTLARVDKANPVVSGFVVSGAANRRVLVRAVGPTLAAFGVNDALRRPVLSIHQGDRLLATNSGWTTGSQENESLMGELLDAFDRAGAFRLLDDKSADNAVVLSLTPGSYTANVSSADGAAGSVLLEIYDLP